MNTARNVTLGISCPHCGQNMPKTVAWLTVHNNMPCEDCGGVINLEMGDIALTIQELGKQCASIDALLTKRE